MSDKKKDDTFSDAHEQEINKGDHVKPEYDEPDRGEDFVWANENTVDSGRSFQVPGNDTSGYVGVSPEYRNYGDPNLKPLLTEEERIALHEQGGYTDDEQVRAANMGGPGAVVMATNPTAGIVSSSEEDDEEGGEVKAEVEVQESSTADADTSSNAKPRNPDGTFTKSDKADDKTPPKL